MRLIAASRRKRDAVYQHSRRAIYERAQGMCEARCNVKCEISGWQVHHIAGREGSDPHRLENLLLVCASCHRFIHDQPAIAYRRGWMRRRNGATPEAAAPVQEAWDA
jgi:5-methylcytosine-specific restriction endonuclease McrA